LIALVGIGLIGAGIFVTDPLNGYPPGTPRIPTERTADGILHDLFGVPVFLGLPLTCVLFGRRFARSGNRAWALYSTVSGIAMFAVFLVARLGMREVPGFTRIAGLFGLFQRVTVTIGFAWLTLLAAHVLTTKNQNVSDSGHPAPQLWVLNRLPERRVSLSRREDALLRSCATRFRTVGVTMIWARIARRLRITATYRRRSDG
jgi:hypothetical protein